ncbi:MAG: hypothetical protein Q9199_001777 [Rusavskia elegans]
MGGLGVGIPLIGCYLGALASSSVLISGLFGAYSRKMTGRRMHQYAREVKDFSSLPAHASESDGSPQTPAPKGGDRIMNRANPVPAISEAEQSRRIRDYIALIPSIEPFGLRWETSTLLRLGASLNAVLKSYIWSAAKFELAKLTIFGTLIAGLWPLGLLQVARVLDISFSVAEARSDKAGCVLAEAFMQKVRPMILVGYSLGARVIYQCLLALAEQNAFGLVESVILIGAPTPSDKCYRRRILATVAGRVVNVFNSDDYILGFLHRTSSFQPVQGVARIETVDITNLMGERGHATYKNIIGRTLQEIGFEDVDLVEVEKEVEALRKREEIERQREEEQQAQGDHEVAQLKAIIDEENALVQDKMRKQTTPNFSRGGHQKRTAKIERILGTDNSTKATQLGDLTYPAPESEPDHQRTSEKSMYRMQSSEPTELVITLRGTATVSVMPTAIGSDESGTILPTRSRTKAKYNEDTVDLRCVKGRAVHVKITSEGCSDQE